jgi:hypothetical protein
VVLIGSSKVLNSSLPSGCEVTVFGMLMLPSNDSGISSPSLYIYKKVPRIKTKTENQFVQFKLFFGRKTTKAKMNAPRTFFPLPGLVKIKYNGIIVSSDISWII